MNLRDRLRTGTRRAQDALDTAFGRFDLADAGGLRAFLAAQADIVAALRRAGDTDLIAVLDRMSAAIAADLSDLGDTAPPEVLPVPSEDEAVARIWLWHATRLGTRMQARRLGPGLPDRTLSTPRDSEAWRTFCDRLEAREGYGAAPDREVTSANEWYALFETTCHAHARGAPRTTPPT